MTILRLGGIQEVIKEALGLIPATKPKREGKDFEIPDIVEVLRKFGYNKSDRAVFRLIKGLGLKRSKSGFYNLPDVVVIFGWLKRSGAYASYEAYLENEGKSIFDQVVNEFGV